MTDEVCACGHLKSEHYDGVSERAYDWGWAQPIEEGGRTALRWFAKNQGSCSRCKCSEYKTKEKERACALGKENVDGVKP
jgi:hypothetical protein